MDAVNGLSPEKRLALADPTYRCSSLYSLDRTPYRQDLRKRTLHTTSEGIYISFETPERGITSGQFAAWYQNNELIGSGVIK